MTHPARINPATPLARLVGETITIADLVANPIWSLSSTFTISQAEDAMAKQEFDAAGINLENSGAPGPTHYVLHSDLAAAMAAGDGDIALSAAPRLCREIVAQDCVERSFPVVRLIELFKERDRLFVLQGNQVGWIATPADLAAPAFSIAVLSYLTLLETGMKQLSIRVLNNEDLEAAMSDGQLEKSRKVLADLTHRNVQTEFRDCLYLDAWLSVARKHYLERLNLSANAFDRIVGPFPDIRNDLAHGRGLFAQPVTVERTLDRVQRIIDFTHRVWDAAHVDQARWDTYAATEIVGENNAIISGVDALDPWPYDSTVFVLTAWNPGAITKSIEENRKANEALREALAQLEADVTPVLGRSPNGTWFEESFLITAVDRGQIMRLAHQFAQTAFFEIDADEMRVVESRSGAVIRTTKRVQACE